MACSWEHKVQMEVVWGVALAMLGVVPEAPAPWRGAGESGPARGWGGSLSLVVKRPSLPALKTNNPPSLQCHLQEVCQQ